MTGLSAESAAQPEAEVTRVEFRTEPARYRHWRLAFDGPVATLGMDVDKRDTAAACGSLRARSRPGCFSILRSSRPLWWR